MVACLRNLNKKLKKTLIFIKKHLKNQIIILMKMAVYIPIKNKITIDDLFVVSRDASSEYDTEKIIVKDENLFKLNSYFSVNSEKSMLSFYGDQNKIKSILYNLFECEIEFPSNSLYKQRITAVYNEKIFILTLLVDDDSFLVRPINQESILITLTRILQDITHNLVICPFDEGLETWWIHTSPYKQSHFKPIDVIIRKRDHSTINCKNILFDENFIKKEYTNNYNQQLLLLTNYSKYAFFINKSKDLNLSQNEMENVFEKLEKPSMKMTKKVL